MSNYLTTDGLEKNSLLPEAPSGLRPVAFATSATRLIRQCIFYFTFLHLLLTDYSLTYLSTCSSHILSASVCQLAQFIDTCKHTDDIGRLERLEFPCLLTTYCEYVHLLVTHRDGPSWQFQSGDWAIFVSTVLTTFCVINISDRSTWWSITAVTVLLVVLLVLLLLLLPLLLVVVVAVVVVVVVVATVTAAAAQQ